MSAFRLSLLALFAFLIPVVGSAQNSGTPELGVDYAIIDPAQPLVGTPGKIEVVEVFSYGCIHCARFEPMLQAWKKKLPADVAFTAFPLSSGGSGETFGRAYYTAESMGLLEQSHEALFNAVHIEKTIQTLEDIPKFYERFGADSKVFESTMNSFAINAKIARAKQIAPRWAIEGTPSIVVNGKYRAMVSRTGGLAGLLATTEWLIEKERAALVAAAD